jgi:hypothetical protein
MGHSLAESLKVEAPEWAQAGGAPGISAQGLGLLAYSTLFLHSSCPAAGPSIAQDWRRVFSGSGPWPFGKQPSFLLDVRTSTASSSHLVTFALSNTAWACASQGSHPSHA